LSTNYFINAAIKYAFMQNLMD